MASKRREPWARLLLVFYIHRDNKLLLIRRAGGRNMMEGPTGPTDQLAADSIRGGQLYGPGRGGLDGVHGGSCPGRTKNGKLMYGYVFYILTLSKLCSLPCNFKPSHLYAFKLIYCTIYVLFRMSILAWKMDAVSHFMFSDLTIKIKMFYCHLMRFQKGNKEWEKKFITLQD